MRNLNASLSIYHHWDEGDVPALLWTGTQGEPIGELVQLVIGGVTHFMTHKQVLQFSAWLVGAIADSPIIPRDEVPIADANAIAGKNRPCGSA